MRILLFLTFASLFMSAQAQSDSDPFGSDYNFDTAMVSDSGYDSYEESPVISQGPDPNMTPTTYKKYERFRPPIDTITDLVTYTGVVPFTPMPNDVYDGGTIDSLYLRAKIFLLKRYIKNYRQSKDPKANVFPKDILVEDFKPDGENGRIIIRPTVPLYVRTNEFTKSQWGTVTFKIEIRVKEEKYKYKLTNFVHNTTEKGSEKPIKTYVEYYANTTRGFKGTDQVLIAIDRMVKELIKDLAAVMRDPIVLDPDDF